ncbi:MAG: alpha-L-fucosidase [Tannerella sp.]|jgi:alpha-L-fucosidase|nr:alpha-L-fucosidase [Tannerella sp.]
MKKVFLFILLSLLPTASFTKGRFAYDFENHIADSSAVIPLPTRQQLHWQQKELMMFISFDPATWQGREYDNHSMPLDRINPRQLNTDQWCETAKSWGARTILFVAKHTGGFCWWDTQTSDYGVRNTPFKRDVLKELSASCRKYGLELGIYVYPGDDQWGAGIGSGGITKDPSKQEAYNKVYRQQLTEVLSNYGAVCEVWFDGSCKIFVNDILEKYAANAVYFQGEMASIRWVGNEDGIAPYPNWYTSTTNQSTALTCDAYGSVYAPVECDVPFLKHGGHKWFWAPNTDHMILSVDELMNLYYKSAGRGAVMLLNSTPDTTGLIPQSHVTRYREFGEEIRRRFGKPLKRTKGKGTSLILNLKRPTEFNHVVLQEDLKYGQRVLEYVIEVADVDGAWRQIAKGASIGQKRIEVFQPVTARRVRVLITDSKATPQLMNFAVYNAQSACDAQSGATSEQTFTVGSWNKDTYSDSEATDVTIDLTPFVTNIGQYELTFKPIAWEHLQDVPASITLSDARLEMYGQDRTADLQQVDGSTFRITRSQQTLDEFKTVLHLSVRKNGKSTGVIEISRITY